MKNSPLHNNSIPSSHGEKNCCFSSNNSARVIHLRRFFTETNVVILNCSVLLCFGSLLFVHCKKKREVSCFPKQRDE